MATRPRLTWRRLSAPTRRIVTLLWDCQRHPWEAIVAEAAVTVPPGKAFRDAEKARLRNKKNSDDDEAPRVRGDHQTAIATGQRQTAIDSMYTLRNVGKIAWEDTDEGRFVWMVPVGDGPLMDEPLPQANDSVVGLGRTVAAPKEQPPVEAKQTTEPTDADLDSVAEAAAMEIPELIILNLNPTYGFKHWRCKPCNAEKVEVSARDAYKAVAKHLQERHRDIWSACVWAITDTYTQPSVDNRRVTG